MFVERYVSSGALFAFLVRWHASTVNLHPSDSIFAKLACPQNDIFLQTMMPLNSCSYFSLHTLQSQTSTSFIFTSLQIKP
jgi:hypothetical protein